MIAPFPLLPPGLGVALEDAVGRDAEDILDSEELAERIEQGQSKTGIAALLIFTPGKADCQRGSKRSSMGTMRA